LIISNFLISLAFDTFPPESARVGPNEQERAGRAENPCFYGTEMAPVRRVKRHGKIRWKVDVRAHGTGRRFFETKDDALRWLQSFEPETGLAEEAWSNLPVLERAKVIAVWREIELAGLTVPEVWRTYKELVGVVKPQPLGKAIDALIESKRAANKRAPYLKNLRGMLNQFAQGREAMSIAAIRTADIEAWLTEHATTPGYRHTWINRLSTLFSFAKRQEWMVQNPCDRVERVVIERKRPQILTVDQAKTCATTIRDEFPVALGWLALALFCGLRPEEAEKLQWSDIDLEKGIVTVDAAASKVRWRRLVYCTPCSIKWLTKAKALNASLPIPRQTRRRALSLMTAKLGLKAWPKDILRHTCASMLMATWEDEGKVAASLGNSPTILHAHYRELVTRAEAKKFWGIAPDKH
jgi:integrase/recombinase XerD